MDVLARNIRFPDRKPHKIPGISPENHELTCYTFIFGYSKKII
jgi:hypothetical protein